MIDIHGTLVILIVGIMIVLTALIYHVTKYNIVVEAMKYGLVQEYIEGREAPIWIQP